MCWCARTADLSLQVDLTWTEVAQPFASQHSLHFGGPEMNLRRRFDWATAIVAAYSFELGDDKFQVDELAAGLPSCCAQLPKCTSAALSVGIPLDFQVQASVAFGAIVKTAKCWL